MRNFCQVWNILVKKAVILNSARPRPVCQVFDQHIFYRAKIVHYKFTSFICTFSLNLCQDVRNFDLLEVFLSVSCSVFSITAMNWAVEKGHLTKFSKQLSETFMFLSGEFRADTGSILF